MTYQIWFLSALFVAFGVFSTHSLVTRRQFSARIQKQGASPFLGLLPMQFAYWLLSPIQKLATRFQWSPNLFSWTCFFLGLASGGVAAMGFISLAGGLCIISGLFDSLDGMVARSRGIASDAGEVLDAAIDRYTEFFFLSGFCIYYRFSPLIMGLVLTTLMGSMLVSYSQAKAEALKTEVPKGWMRRPERIAYLGGGAFISPLLTSWLEPSSLYSKHYLFLCALTLVAFFSNITAIQRFLFLYRKFK